MRNILTKFNIYKQGLLMNHFIGSLDKKYQKVLMFLKLFCIVADQLGTKQMVFVPRLYSQPCLTSKNETGALSSGKSYRLSTLKDQQILMF